MALRDADVQPPKTAATQSLLISFSAFSAKTVGSEAPSSVTTDRVLPLTPPAALISSAAICSESCTVFSLIAIVPDNEFRKPILTVSPDVSTQLAAATPGAAEPDPPAAVEVVDVESTREPQAVSA